MSTALEAILRRDRAVVVAALALITALAWADLVWLANDMGMGGMDMSGFRMIPAGQGLMMPAERPMAANRVRLRFRHVGRDDDRHDDAFGGADDPYLRPRWATGGERRQAVRRERLVRSRVPIVLDGLFAGRRRRRNGRWSARRC